MFASAFSDALEGTRAKYIGQRPPFTVVGVSGRVADLYMGIASKHADGSSLEHRAKVQRKKDRDRENDLLSSLWVKLRSQSKTWKRRESMYGCAMRSAALLRSVIIDLFFLVKLMHCIHF